MSSFGAFFLILGLVSVISTSVIVVVASIMSGVTIAYLGAYNTPIIYVLIGCVLYYSRARELNFNLKYILIEALRYFAPGVPFLMIFVSIMAFIQGVHLKLVLEVALYGLIYLAHRKGYF